MSEGSGKKSPRTLADVSHLFFTGADERGPTERADDRRELPGERSAVAESRAETRIFVVTGSDAGPGKSTIAVNLAQALLKHGTVGLYDADPRVPNARFYLGLPSWSYLSPLTGEPVPTPIGIPDSGLIVVDWTAAAPAAERTFSGPVTLEVPGADPCRLDFAVVDAPVGTAASLRAGTAAELSYLVVGEPGRDGFERTFAALARLARDTAATAVGLTVNRVPSLSYAKSFWAKMRLAAHRLLSVEAHFLGGVIREPNLGSTQRERGVLVESRPDAAAAMLLSQVTANALDLGGRGDSPQESTATRTETDHETKDRTITAA